MRPHLALALRCAHHRPANAGIMQLTAAGQPLPPVPSLYPNNRNGPVDLPINSSDCQTYQMLLLGVVSYGTDLRLPEVGALGCFACVVCCMLAAVTPYCVAGPAACPRVTLPRFHHVPAGHTDPATPAVHNGREPATQYDVRQSHLPYVGLWLLRAAQGFRCLTALIGDPIYVTSDMGTVLDMSQAAPGSIVIAPAVSTVLSIRYLVITGLLPLLARAQQTNGSAAAQPQRVIQDEYAKELGGWASLMWAFRGDR
jgi:hypothetical protein